MEVPHFSYSLHLVDDLVYLIVHEEHQSRFDGLVLKGCNVVADICDRSDDGNYKPIDLEFLPHGKGYIETSWSPRTIAEEIKNMQREIGTADMLGDGAWCYALLRGLTDYQQKLKDTSIQEIKPRNQRKDDGQISPDSYGRG
jgi:hypothetical protein